MKRNPRKLKWTKAYRKNAGKEMVVDSTLLFGARRNEPVRYNRDLVQKTLGAMQRISEIRARRERVFYKKRMAGKRERELTPPPESSSPRTNNLLPRMRGSEKRRLEDWLPSRVLDVEELAAEHFAKRQARHKLFAVRRRGSGYGLTVVLRVMGTMRWI
ncbi:hypothetical protein J3459_016959 [Metarhizium acridum]|nr:hypothetical protein J3459_016959 [Metarhizium acridum]